MAKDSDSKTKNQGTLWDLDERALWEKEWHGMPEFVQENLEPAKSLKVNFLTLDDYGSFCKLINQKLTIQTKSIWFPEVAKGPNSNKTYTDERSKMIEFTNYPIYVPSKGRADVAMTIKILTEERLHFYVVIEKEDFESYIESEKFCISESQILVLPSSNQGIAYVRNFCKDHATKAGHEYHWQIDDNIKAFKKMIDLKKVATQSLELFREVENYVGRYSNIGIAGLKHIAFAFAAKDTFSLNKQCYSCVLVKNSIDIFWRKGLVEDTDYSLNLLSKGFCTLTFNRLVIDKAATLKMKGGNTEIEYSGVKRLKRALGLQAMWPGVFKIVTLGDLRVKVKPSQVWKQFKQQPLLIEEGK
jgi:hypothetical protein